MAASNNYTIYYSDPAKANTPVTVQDGVVDNLQLSINLVGRNAAGYGQAVAENFVHMLENFSSSTPPGNALTGQLWYDASEKVLKVLNGQWYPVGGVFRQGLQPSNANAGDIWVDTSKQQMYIINGSNEAILIGPNYSGTTRTGLYATTSTDIYGTVHDIVINYINDNPIEVIASDSLICFLVVKWSINFLLAITFFSILDKESFSDNTSNDSYNSFAVTSISPIFLSNDSQNTFKSPND